MPVDTGMLRYLSGQFQAPDRAAIDEDRSRNALLRADVADVPIRREAMQLDNEARRQQNTEGPKKGARAYLANVYGAITQSPTALKHAEMLMRSPDYQAALKLLGMQPSQLGPQDTDESIRQEALTMARVMGGQVEQGKKFTQRDLPSGARIQTEEGTGQESVVLQREPNPASQAAPDRELVAVLDPNTGKAVYRPRPQAAGMQPAPGAGQQPTEGQRKGALLYDSMVKAEQQIADLQTQGKKTDTGSMWNAALGAAHLPALQSDEYKQYEAAGLRWAANLLYSKSGATATPDEIRSTWKQFFPQPGEGPDVVTQKDAARMQEMQSAARSVGAPPPQINRGGASGGWTVTRLD